MVAIATVIDSRGSVPGKPGARLVIASSGARHGTVGGAGLEKRVEAALMDMIRGAENGGRGSGGEVVTYTLHRDAKGDGTTPLDSLCGGRVTVAMEVLSPMPHLLISGGGHCGFALAALCDTLDWSHSVQDVRPEYASVERYPNAIGLHPKPVEEFLAELVDGGLNRFTDVLLLGHDWAVDQELLLGLLSMRADAPNPRIGVIGSTAKWSAFRDAASESGVPSGWIDSVRCPIGLDIGAERPEEIAIAVCAEILAMESGSSGR